MAHIPLFIITDEDNNEVCSSSCPFRDLHWCKLFNIELDTTDSTKDWQSVRTFDCLAFENDQ